MATYAITLNERTASGKALKAHIQICFDRLQYKLIKMKQRLLFLIASLLLSVAGVQTAFAQKMKINLVTGKTVKYKVSQIKNVEFEEEEPMGEHEWVDLGLPSGTLWATTNIGAENPEDNGYLIAWGETEPKETYSWATYQHYDSASGQLTKYNLADGLTELEPEDDAATENWGSGWKMPTKEQFDELISNTTSQRTTVNGKSVCCFTSKMEGYTDQSIIFPIGETGDYWVSTPLYDLNYPYHLSVWFVSWYTDDLRYVGNYIRPVRKQ